MRRERLPIATWRDFYLVAITKVGGLQALREVCIEAAIQAGNTELLRAIANSSTFGVDTLCWLLDENRVAVTTEAIDKVLPSSRPTG